MADDLSKEIEEVNAKMGVEPEKSGDEPKEADASTEEDQAKQTEAEDTTEESTDSDTESEEQSEDKPDENEEDSEEESTFKKRFTQFKGDTPEEYIPNLEDAYYNSSAEALRLKQENEALKERINNPESTQQDSNEQTTPTEQIDPALAYSRKELKRRMDEDYAKFKDEYPIITREPEIVQKLDAATRRFAEQHLAETGEYMDLYDALKMGAAYLGLEPDKSEKIASAAKNQAAMSKSSTGSKKPAPKEGEFTKSQLAVAEKMGLNKEQLSEFNK